MDWSIKSTNTPGTRGCRRLLLLAVVALATRDKCIAAEPSQPRTEPAAAVSSIKSTAARGIARPTSGRYLGSRSCSATACHGSIEPDVRNVHSVARNEFHVWLDHDPHERAERDLHSPAARQMFHALGAMVNGQIPPEKQAQYQQLYDRCAACHSLRIEQAEAMPHSRRAARPVRSANSYEEGVGCESCHGPSSNWVTRHYRDDFQALSADEKCGLGMTDTGNLWVRARLCAQCHIGDAGRDVNHDLIAAGHPMLKFELATYLSLLPKHWKVAKDRAEHGDDPGFELQLWAIGQLASAEASLELLSHRAGQAQAPSAVWPEFSEYDCYACHHEIEGAGSWRPQIGFRELPQPDGAGPAQLIMPWSTWNLALLQDLADDSRFHQSEPEFARRARLLSDVLAELKQNMQRSLVPPPRIVADQAADAHQALVEWQTTWRANENTDELAVAASGIRDSLVQLASESGAVANWDRATQLYLGLKIADQCYRSSVENGAAGTRTVLTETDDTIRVRLRELRDQLAMPADEQGRINSPRQFRGLLDERSGASARSAIQAMLRQTAAQIEERAKQDTRRTP